MMSFNEYYERFYIKSKLYCKPFYTFFGVGYCFSGQSLVICVLDLNLGSISVVEMSCIVYFFRFSVHDIFF
jgi:hypothetical protein